MNPKVTFTLPQIKLKAAKSALSRKDVTAIVSLAGTANIS
jgi:hypothetical protein